MRIDKDQDRRGEPKRSETIARIYSMSWRDKEDRRKMGRDK